MKVMTVLGTRPEIIRLSQVIPLLDHHSSHILVHTGQNFDDRLSGLFFRELGIREPDDYMGVRGATFGEQVAQILSKVEQLFLRHRPDRLLILGDTNSGLTAIVARRLGIPVFHMEAGNRCYDDRVPEEINRRVIDHTSSVLLPYTNRSRENLIREGIANKAIFVTGNPIKQVLNRYADVIDASDAVTKHELTPERFFLATMHRAENVDREDKLRQLIDGFHRLAKSYDMPMICSLHPRTRSKIAAFDIGVDRERVRFIEPLGFFEFIKLEKMAFCVLSDSGTVQEETCILRRPNVTIREVTERPETVECGSNYLCGTNPADIVRAVELVTRNRKQWMPPEEYEVENVAETVCRIVTGYRPLDAAEIEWQSKARA